MRLGRRLFHSLQRTLFGPEGVDLSGRVLYSQDAWPLGSVVLVLLAGELLPSLVLAWIHTSTPVDIPLAAFILLQPAAVLAVIWLVNPFRERSPAGILPVNISGRGLLEYAIIWGIFLRIVSVAVVMVQALVGAWSEVTNNPLLLADSPLSTIQQGIIVLSAVFLVPVAEELFYRGILYRALGRHFGLAGAAVISTALWTLLHGSAMLFPAIFALGILLVLLYEATESIWPPIAAHVGFNLTSFLLIWLLPGLV